MKDKKTILVAPLNWGLGHATRCIPIINALIERGFNVLIASDGAALELLKQEFPEIPTVALPSYNISYSKHKRHFKAHLIKRSPQILKAIFKEHKLVGKLIEQYNIAGIISDNRYGVRRKVIPSVIMTHQVRVLSGKTTRLSASLHKKLLKKFDAVWIPDFEQGPGLSGIMGHLNPPLKHSKYIGPLSRFKNATLPKQYDLLILLSGPEPGRSILEGSLRTLLVDSSKKILLVQGVVQKTVNKTQLQNMTLVNYLTSRETEKALLESEQIICRSGYTSLMDLAVLQKKAFLIPTPGQYEQEYLAELLQNNRMLPFAKQEDFKLEDLDRLEQFNGLPVVNSIPDFDALFSLF
ncbi:MAG: glycosyltransferase [Gilvibacter sp.]